MIPLSKRVDVLETQVRSIQTSLPRGVNFGALTDRDVIVLPLADGSFLVMRKTAPHRIVRRLEPTAFAGDPMREARELRRLSDELTRACVELGEDSEVP